MWLSSSIPLITILPGRSANMTVRHVSWHTMGMWSFHLTFQLLQLCYNWLCILTKELWEGSHKVCCLWGQLCKGMWSCTQYICLTKMIDYFETEQDSCLWMSHNEAAATGSIRRGKWRGSWGVDYWKFEWQGNDHSSHLTLMQEWYFLPSVINLSS
jgi:hypothetical protein